jgi:GTP 3',8-cyclase
MQGIPTDYYLRLSITDRCNLRCVYCLPQDARFATDTASEAELLALARLVARAVPIRKIRITGGEPTLHPGLMRIVASVRELADEVVMTSNGVLLAPLLQDLRAAGLDRITISLDAVDAAGFRRTARRDGLAAVIAAIRQAVDLGFPRVKINTVAMQETDAAGLVRLAVWLGVHVRFIELMAIGEARAFHASAAIDASAIRQRIIAAGIRLQERTDLDEPTARIWAIDDLDPATCSVGCITTVSAPFCATCDRLRLTARGRFHTCLFDEDGVDLLAPLRAGDGDGVIARVRAAVGAKAPPSAFVRASVMAGIGG